MPTNKPRVQSIIEPEVYSKFKYICQKEMRTESKMASYIICKYVEEYEKNNGEINQVVNNSGVMQIGIQNNRTGRE